MEISPKAAEERGIKNGDMVKVFNDRGFVVLRAVINKGLRPDTIHLPHGWQSADYVAGHHQNLTRSRLDLICGNNCFNDFLCEVEKWNGGEQ